MRVPVGINTLAGVVSHQLGSRLDPYLGHNFMVEIDGLLTGGFSQVTGLEASVEVKEHAEGGVNGYLHKIPGETRYPNLVLSHGITGLDTLHTWFADVSKGTIKRRNISIMLLDPRRWPVMWWNVLGALPVKWKGPAFNAGGDAEVAIESLELVHKGIEKPPLSRLLGVGRAAGDYFF
ncbi:MAG: phage tail protein [Byssovorax sp.]